MGSNYRKIYEYHYGPISRDKDGRKYEVHHIDGNHKNNFPENLKAVSIQEHYDIHYAQGDWGACQAMAMRMEVSPEEFRNICLKAAQKRVAAGFLPPVHKGKNHPFYGKVGAATGYKWSAKQKNKVTGENHWAYGTHPLFPNRKRPSSNLRRKTRSSAIILDNLLNIEVHTFCLKEWCEENKLNYMSFRTMVSKDKLYKKRYSYRIQ